MTVPSPTDGRPSKPRARQWLKFMLGWALVAGGLYYWVHSAALQHQDLEGLLRSLCFLVHLLAGGIAMGLGIQLLRTKPGADERDRLAALERRMEGVLLLAVVSVGLMLATSTTIIYASCHSLQIRLARTDARLLELQIQHAKTITSLAEALKVSPRSAPNSDDR